MKKIRVISVMMTMMGGDIEVDMMETRGGV